jgi:hypothetical protein
MSAVQAAPTPDAAIYEAYAAVDAMCGHEVEVTESGGLTSRYEIRDLWRGILHGIGFAYHGYEVQAGDVRCCNLVAP